MQLCIVTKISGSLWLNRLIDWEGKEHAAIRLILFSAFFISANLLKLGIDYGYTVIWWTHFQIYYIKKQEPCIYSSERYLPWNSCQHRETYRTRAYFKMLVLKLQAKQQVLGYTLISGWNYWKLVLAIWVILQAALLRQFSNMYYRLRIISVKWCNLKPSRRDNDYPKQVRKKLLRQWSTVFRIHLLNSDAGYYSFADLRRIIIR